VDFDQPFQVWVHVAVLKINKDSIDPFYLAYALNSLRSYEQSQLLTKGATNQDLGLNRMSRIRFCLPPLDEQKRIVLLLDEVVGTIQTAVRNTKDQIDLIREYRTRLIADVVTGKLDVRGMPLPEPDADDAPDDFDDLEGETPFDPEQDWPDPEEESDD